MFIKRTCNCLTRWSEITAGRKGRTDMGKANHEPVRPGICPACLKPITREQRKVAKAFKCPHCQKLVRTSKLFRTSLYLVSYGIPTVIVFCSWRSLIETVLLWLLLAFACAMIYIAIATAIRPPQFELFLEKEDEFQSLDLTK